MRSKVWWWTPPLHGLNIEREARSIYFWPIHASQHAVLTISRELWVGMKKVWLKALLLHSTPFGLLKYFSNLQLLLTRFKNFDVDLNPSSDSFQFLHLLHGEMGASGKTSWILFFRFHFNFVAQNEETTGHGIGVKGLKMSSSLPSSQQLYSWRSKAAQCKHAMWARFN